MNPSSPGENGNLPDIVHLSDNTPTEILVCDKTVNIIHYFQKNGPASKLHAVPPGGEPVYDIFLESGGIFLKAGSYSFQLIARPVKAWQRDLRLTAGSLKILDNHNARIEAEKQQRSIDDLRNNFFRSFAEVREPKKEIKPEIKEESIDPELIRLMHKLSDALKRTGFPKRVEAYNDASSRNTHIVLFQNNTEAGKFINIMLQRLNTGRKSDRKFHLRGGRFETIVKKLCEIINCEEELERVLKNTKPDARIKLKHYCHGSAVFKFPHHTGAILVEEKNR